MQTLICRGQSMFPTLLNGDKILVENFDMREIAPFDILVYRNNVAQVCHRVFKIGRESGKRLFYTKGDFNFFITEKIKEDDCIGRVVGIYRKGELRGLRLERTLPYYIFVSAFSLLKEAVRWYLGKIYNFPFARRLIKRIAPLDRRHIYTAPEDEEDFNGFYNFFPFEASRYQIELRILARYKNCLLGKLWIVKERDTGRVFIYGPYVKLFFRARNIGKDLSEAAVNFLRNNLFLDEAFTFIPRREKQLILFYGSLGFAIIKDNSKENFLFMQKSFAGS